MPLIARQRTFRSALFDVILSILLAPLVLIVAISLTQFGTLLMLVAFFVLTCIIAGAGIRPPELDARFAINCGGTFLFILVAAIPLAIRDALYGPPLKTWEHDPATEAAARRYAELLLARDFDAIRSHCSPALIDEMASHADFAECFESDLAAFGQPVKIISCQEIPIPEPGPDDFDAAVDVRFETSSPLEKVGWSLFLNAAVDHKIVYHEFYIIEE